MQKIAILYCKELAEECSGYRCFDAFHKRADSFASYDGDVQIAGFFCCNGCDKFSSEQMKLKFSQIEKSEVGVIHIALCVLNRCKSIDALLQSLPTQMSLIKGSHV